MLTQSDVERITRATLKDLGLPAADVSIQPDSRPGQWRIDIRSDASRPPRTLHVKCGEGTSAQWVRSQIFDQINSR